MAVAEVEILGAVARLQIEDIYPVLDAAPVLAPLHGKRSAGNHRALETILERAGYGLVGVIHPGRLDIEIGDL